MPISTREPPQNRARVAVVTKKIRCAGLGSLLLRTKRTGLEEKGKKSSFLLKSNLVVDLYLRTSKTPSGKKTGA